MPVSPHYFKQINVLLPTFCFSRLLRFPRMFFMYFKLAEFKLLPPPQPQQCAPTFEGGVHSVGFRFRLDSARGVCRLPLCWAPWLRQAAERVAAAPLHLQSVPSPEL